MIGVSCTHFSSSPAEDWIERISKSFGHWEIFSEACHSVTANTDSIGEIMRSYDMGFSIHTPICDLNVASLTDRMRDASVREIVAHAEAANRLGVEVLTVHPGLDSMAVRGVTDSAVARARESMRTFDAVSREYGVTMAIENMPVMPFFLGRTAEQLGEIIDGTDLGVCFDIGHANTTGQIGEMMSRFRDRIVNVHIHDNHGSSDEHLTIGDGDIDFEPVLEGLRGYRGTYIIESRDFDSATVSQDRLSRMIRSRRRGPAGP